MKGNPKLYSYVVEHDTGYAPNPYFGACTLCRCKFREEGQIRRNIVELAQEGDWIVGTGGANKESSPGHGKLVFAMRVDEKLTRQAYNTNPQFHKKKPLIGASYARQRGDNLRPASTFERHNQFVLISWHFYYFGGNAVTIPKELSGVEKSGPGFKSRFATVFILRFIRWLETNYKPGKHGEPCERKLNGCGRRKPGC